MTPAGNYVLIAGISYVLGIFTGVFLKCTVLSPDKVKKTEANNLVLIVVSMMWAMSMVFDILNPEYTTSPLVHGLMGAIVGFFYKPSKEK